MVEPPLSILNENKHETEIGIVRSNDGVEPIVQNIKISRLDARDLQPCFLQPTPSSLLEEAQSSSSEEASKVKSWSNIVNSYKINGTLSPFDVGLENNELKIPMDVSKDGYTQWENSLVGSFIDKKLSFYSVKSWAERIWKDSLNEVISLDNGFFIFKLKSKEDVESILDKGPYYFGSRLIIVKKWAPGMLLTKEGFSSVPIWVKFYNVPLELWTNIGLGYVASVIGKPLFLDKHSKSKTRHTFARICIEVQANKRIPETFSLNLGYGSSYEIRVEVPWKLLKCDSCMIFRHSGSCCPNKPHVASFSVPKQVWQMKADKKLDNNQGPGELEEVKKKKGKSVLNVLEFSGVKVSSSLNKFNVLESSGLADEGLLVNEKCDRNECSSSAVLPMCVKGDNMDNSLINVVADQEESSLKEEDMLATSTESFVESTIRRSTRMRLPLKPISDENFVGHPYIMLESKKKLLESIENLKIGRGKLDIPLDKSRKLSLSKKK